jgi:hypothetical protein
MHRRRAVRTAGSSAVGVAAAGALAVAAVQADLPAVLRGSSGEAEAADAGLVALLEEGPVGTAPQCGGAVTSAPAGPVEITLGGHETRADSDQVPIIVTLTDGPGHVRVDTQRFYAARDGVVVGVGEVSATGADGAQAPARGTVTGRGLAGPQPAPEMELCPVDDAPTGLPLPAGTYELYAAIEGAVLDPDEPDSTVAAEISEFAAHSAPLTLVVD